MKNEIRHATRAFLNLSEAKRHAGAAKAWNQAAADLWWFFQKYDRLTRTQKLLKLRGLIDRWNKRATAAEERACRCVR